MFAQAMFGLIRPNQASSKMSLNCGKTRHIHKWCTPLLARKCATVHLLEGKSLSPCPRCQKENYWANWCCSKYCTDCTPGRKQDAVPATVSLWGQWSLVIRTQGSIGLDLPVAKLVTFTARNKPITILMGIWGPFPLCLIGLALGKSRLILLGVEVFPGITNSNY